MPLFSNIPVLATPSTAVTSGLMCTHNECFALFSTLDEAKTHAIAVHAGKVAVITCGIYQHHLKNGKIRLYRVLEGENFGDFHRPENLHLPWKC